MLKLSRVSASYGDTRVLHGISLEVRQGETVTLLGRNGMGKSTTLKTIIGILRPVEGKILLDHREIQDLPAFKIARLGVGYVPEDRRIFPSLTVLENLNFSVRKEEEGWPLEKIFEFFPVLRDRISNKGYQLSGGEQQMLAIARVLRKKTKILLVDEPTEGLSPLVVRAIAEVLKQIKSEGITTLLVEQNAKFVSALADRYYIISHGQIVYEGTKADFQKDEEVKRKYLGV